MSQATSTRKAPSRARKEPAKPVETEETEKDVLPVKDLKEQKAAAAAAAAEVTSDADENAENAKKVEWEGLSLELPAELPSEVLFDFVELEDNDSPLPILRMLKSLVGEENFHDIRGVVREKGGGFEHVLAAFNAVTGAYGVGLGE